MGTLSDVDVEELNAGLNENNGDYKTLYSLYRDNQENTRQRIEKLWSDHRLDRNYREQGQYVNALGAYREIEYDEARDFNDDGFIDMLFHNSGIFMEHLFEYQFKNCHIVDAKSFYDTFQQARKFVYHAIVQFPEVLTRKSFPATYFHKDILMMFDAIAARGASDSDGSKLGMFDEEYAQKRIGGTSEIILRTLFGAKGQWSFNPRVLANCLMLAEMHNHASIGGNRDPFNKHALYNQSSAAFTLLTFSYFVGRSISKKFNRGKVKWEGSLSEAHWYFFWKALGSSMGIRTELLPDTQTEAEALWGEFLASDKLLDSKSLRSLVEAENGVDVLALDFSTGSKKEEDSLFGRKIPEVIELLEIVKKAALPIENNGSSIFIDSELVVYESQAKIVSQAVKAKKIYMSKNSMLKILELIRHKHRTMNFMTIRMAAIRNSDEKRDTDPEDINIAKLIHLVNLIHLLDVYKTALGRLPEDIPKGMKASLVFNSIWPLKIRAAYSTLTTQKPIDEKLVRL